MLPKICSADEGAALDEMRHATYMIVLIGRLCFSTGLTPRKMEEADTAGPIIKGRREEEVWPSREETLA